jgi:hypothetical protein
VRVEIRNARRGFGKYSQRGNRFAMVLDPIAPGVAIEARVLSADAPASGGPEGLLLEVPSNALQRIAVREGYDASAFGEIQQAAESEGVPVAEFLWELLSDCAFDTAKYRERLFARVGYASPHYIPHPVGLGEGKAALTFLAPGSEGSGSSRVVPVRVRTGNGPLMTAAQAWSRRANDTQLAYFATCFLGALHGICQRELVEDVICNSAFEGLVRTALARHQAAEMQRFLTATGLAGEVYLSLLGEPSMLPARSGLNHLLERAPGV